MGNNSVINAQRVMYKPQKEIVLEKLKDMINIDMKDIRIDSVHPLGWNAIIRSRNIDFVFTYYGEGCWKIESFPVYAMDCNALRSARP